jgi:hypothetical protein
MAFLPFPDGCGYNVDPIPDLPFISDCGVPDPLPPIDDCPDVDLPIPISGQIGPMGPEGPQGPPGADGATGPQGPGPKAFLLWKCFIPGIPEPDTYKVVSNDLSFWIGFTVKIDGVCWIVLGEIEADADLIAFGITDDNSCGQCGEVEAFYADCSRCDACWKLTRCDMPGDVIYTRTDMAEHEGKAVQINDEDYCRIVSLSDVPCFEAQDVEFKQVYADCTKCLKCYTLQSCADPEEDPIVAYFDPTLYVTGKTVEEIIEDEDVFIINGTCYTLVGESMDCAGAVPMTPSSTLTSCDECGCYPFTRCGTETTLQVYAADDSDSASIDLDTLVGKTVSLDDDLCYEVGPRGSGSPYSCIRVNVRAIFDKCDYCKFYTLDQLNPDCVTSPVTTIKTWANLSGHTTGDILKSGSDCYELTGSTTDGTGAVAFTVDSAHSDCESCYQTRKYKLTGTDCSGSTCGEGGEGESVSPIVTTTDLGSAAGKYVKVSGRCYKVEDGTGESVTDAEITYEGPFDGCPECHESGSNDQPAMTHEFAGSTLKIYHYVLRGGAWCKQTLEIPLSIECPTEE